MRLLALTDPLGYLEPCGCQQRPLGGVDRLATAIAKLRADGVPTLFVATGDLFFGGDVHAADRGAAGKQELWNAETLIGVWSELKLDVASPGAGDRARNSEAMVGLVGRAGFAVLDSRSTDTHTFTTKVGSLQVGVVRIQQAKTSPKTTAEGSQQAGPDRHAPLDAAEMRIATLRKQGCELVIALVNGDRRFARRAARLSPDLVVMGGLDQEAPLVPAQYDQGVLLHAGRQGQGVLAADLWLNGTGPVIDRSGWSRDSEAKRLQKQVGDLQTRILAWEADTKVASSDLQRQRLRIRRLQEQQEKLKRAPSAATSPGRSLDARWIELDPEVPSDARIAARMDTHDRRVNDHNKEALAKRLPPEAPPGSPSYVGSDSCGSCHAGALRWWKGHPHGHAYATLEKRHKQFNLSCVGCHVTGYNQPGGSAVVQTRGLQNVGCESCHGPGSLHQRSPSQPGLGIVKRVPETTCTACHNQEHSARFEYPVFKAMLMAPGHGLPE